MITRRERVYCDDLWRHYEAPLAIALSTDGGIHVYVEPADLVRAGRIRVAKPLTVWPPPRD